MRVLFVRGGNKGTDPISTRQGESLVRNGIIVTFFDIKGKGITGYLSNIFRLRRTVKASQTDIIHTHYSFGGFLASISLTGKPVVASLMGSDVMKSSKLLLCIIRFFTRYLWSCTIVKSRLMFNTLGLRSVEIIPNGVDMDTFTEGNICESLQFLNWKSDRKHILFASDPERPEKNFPLAAEAIKILEEKELVHAETHFLKNIPPDQVYRYYQAADVLLLTSFHEGSPNVIKEAMACNCPVVSTDVGDVRELIADTPNCYITAFDPAEISDKLHYILLSGKRSDGRDRIKHIGDTIIANRLIDIYKNILQRVN